MAHKYPPWRRAILVPFWIIQLILTSIIVVILALGTAVLNKHYDPNDFGNDLELDAAVDDLTKIYAPIYISLSAVCFVVTILEIVFLTRHKLTPLKFLIANVIKSTIWAGLFIVDIVGWAQSSATAQSAGAIIVELGIVLSFWIPLIYSGIIFNKNRKAKGAYAPVSHPLSTPAGAAHDTSYPSQIPIPHPHAHRDVEFGGQHDYRGQVTGTTGNTAPYDPYKPVQSHGDLGLAHPSPNLMSPGIPQVNVQHYDERHNVYEMGARRNLD